MDQGLFQRRYWETVEDVWDGQLSKLQRLRVDGGWLYRIEREDYVDGMSEFGVEGITFVPDPTTGKRIKKMGCDAFADENGEIRIEISKYESGEHMGFVEVTHLEPNEKLNVEFVKGEER